MRTGRPSGRDARACGGAPPRPPAALRAPTYAPGRLRVALPVGTRAAHRRAAVLLGEMGAPIDRIAAQLVLAPPAGDPSAVESLRAAARTSLAAGARRQRAHLPAPRARRATSCRASGRRADRAGRCGRPCRLGRHRRPPARGAAVAGGRRAGESRCAGSWRAGSSGGRRRRRPLPRSTRRWRRFRPRSRPFAGRSRPSTSPRRCGCRSYTRTRSKGWRRWSRPIRTTPAR